MCSDMGFEMFMHVMKIYFLFSAYFIAIKSDSMCVCIYACIHKSVHIKVASLLPWRTHHAYTCVSLLFPELSQFLSRVWLPESYPLLASSEGHVVSMTLSFSGSFFQSLDLETGHGGGRL